MDDGRIMNPVKSHSLRTIREEFNEYDLEDGNIIRSKQAINILGKSPYMIPSHRGTKHLEPYYSKLNN